MPANVQLFSSPYNLLNGFHSTDEKYECTRLTNQMLTWPIFTHDGLGTRHDAAVTKGYRAFLGALLKLDHFAVGYSMTVDRAQRRLITTRTEPGFIRYQDFRGLVVADFRERQVPGSQVIKPLKRIFFWPEIDYTEVIPWSSVDWESFFRYTIRNEALRRKEGAESEIKHLQTVLKANADVLKVLV